MKKIIFNSFLFLGWILLFLFVGTTILYNKFSSSREASLFTPIAWENQVAIVEGVIACSLTDSELAIRTEKLKMNLFSKVQKKVELEDGFVFYFEDKENLMDSLMEFIRFEKKCCPFFKFDLSILPYGNGIALKISGGEGVKDFLQTI